MLATWRPPHPLSCDDGCPRLHHLGGVDTLETDPGGGEYILVLPLDMVLAKESSSPPLVVPPPVTATCNRVGEICCASRRKKKLSRTWYDSSPKFVQRNVCSWSRLTFSVERCLPGSTMLLRLRDGCGLPPRLDSRADGADTGRMVSCVYFVGRTGGTLGKASRSVRDGGGRESSGGGAHGGGGLKLLNTEVSLGTPGTGKSAANWSGDGQMKRAPEADGSESGLAGPGLTALDRVTPEGSLVLDPMPGRLVLFRSDKIWKEVQEVHGGDQYLIMFWMHKAAGHDAMGERDGKDNVGV